MYRIVNKATFIVVDTIKAYIKKSIKLINTTSLYEKEIYKWLEKNYKDNDVKLNKLLAPEIEARYKLTNKILDNLNIKQVIEIAAGYSSRGIIYAEKGYEYIEMDLEVVQIRKKDMKKKKQYMIS